MTKIKICGLKRACDIEHVNELLPEYIGFVFAKRSKRYVSFEKAKELKAKLNKEIAAVGVFVDENINNIVWLLENRIIDIVQLHGNEDENYINELRRRAACCVIKAFTVRNNEDIVAAKNSTADYVLLDSGGGSGETFDWSQIKDINRSYFLAGGLTPENVRDAINELHPYAVDASSSLETDGYKDRDKMMAFVKAVRERED